jgi:hypothetical protein
MADEQRHRENKAIRRILCELKQWKAEADGLPPQPAAVPRAPAPVGSMQIPILIDDDDRESRDETITHVKH